MNTHRFNSLIMILTFLSLAVSFACGRSFSTSPSDGEPSARPVGTTPGVNDLYLEAVRQGKLSDVRLYLEERGAEVRARDRLGNNALSLAARSKQATSDLVRYVLDREKSEAADVQNAVKPAAHVPMVRSVDARGRSPLSWAAGEGRLDLVELYLDRGAEVREDVDAHDRGPVYYAAVAGETETLRRILEAGAAVDAADHLCETPLIAASVRARADTVRVLIEAGASVHRRDQEGRTALDRVQPERVRGSSAESAAAYKEIRAMLSSAEQDAGARKDSAGDANAGDASDANGRSANEHNASSQNGGSRCE